ncbi:MAG: Ni/Fe hydrogenase subunit alpha [Myxococcales bacterium]|jgi:coenzyme F420-reducing hydrogenase alpha subunit
MTTKTIKVDVLSRVEGEGALLVRFKGNKPVEVKLTIYEPPRFFEGLLRGRSQMEVPDITARICGICPVAYQMSACHAIEDALGVRVEGTLRALRRLLYCGEWIESHVLHIFMLHAPDFLGFDDVLRMAKVYPDEVKAALRMKKAGNSLVDVVGGRAIHPVNVRLGGFYRAPDADGLRALLPELRWGRDTVLATLPWLAKLPFPEFSRDYEFVALRHPDEYPLCEGRLVSNRGLDIAVRDYDVHFVEDHVPHSNALTSRLRGRGSYHVGPLARVNLNFDRLSDDVRRAADAIGFTVPCTNPFKSLLARGLETAFAFEEAIAIIEGYVPPKEPFVAIVPKASTGYGCSEAPRGILVHRYTVDDAGLVVEAKIVPPTAQNQRCIEEDLFALAPSLVDLPHAQATLRAEQAVRNYDPCISCATHFLRLTVEG